MSMPRIQLKLEGKKQIRINCDDSDRKLNPPPHSIIRIFLRFSLLANRMAYPLLSQSCWKAKASANVFGGKSFPCESAWNLPNKSPMGLPLPTKKESSIVI